MKETRQMDTYRTVKSVRWFGYIRKHTGETPEETRGGNERGTEGEWQTVKNPGFQAGFLNPDR